MKKDKEALERKLSIENSQAFIKMEEKTQILITKKIKPDIFRTRQTHVYETATIANIIAININYKKMHELTNVCLVHDLGHPPFGHTSARYLNKVFKAMGVEEGFCDNASIFEVLNNNSIALSNYEIASLIKYPNRLYPNHTEYLNNLLNNEIKKESGKWGNKLKRTVACEIMDIADMISYATSDIVDAYTTGYTVSILESKLLEIMNIYAIKREYVEIFTAAAHASKIKNKRLLRKCMIELKTVITNDFYWDYNLATLVPKNKDTLDILNEIVKFNSDFFIKNDKVKEERDEAINSLEQYLNFFLENPDKLISSFYQNKYLKSNNKLDKLRVIRDMVADTSDQFVLNWANNNRKSI